MPGICGVCGVGVYRQLQDLSKTAVFAAGRPVRPTRRKEMAFDLFNMADDRKALLRASERGPKSPCAFDDAVTPTKLTGLASSGASVAFDTSNPSGCAARLGARV